MNRTDDAASSPIRENTRPLFSLSRDTLATTLRPEPLANQPPLTQAYIFRDTPAQVAPTPGARPILLRAGEMMLSLAVHRHRSRSPPPLPRALANVIVPSSCRPARKKKRFIRTTSVRMGVDDTGCEHPCEG